MIHILCQEVGQDQGLVEDLDPEGQDQRGVQGQGNDQGQEEGQAPDLVEEGLGQVLGLVVEDQDQDQEGADLGQGKDQSQDTGQGQDLKADQKKRDRHRDQTISLQGVH